MGTWGRLRRLAAGLGAATTVILAVLVQPSLAAAGSCTSTCPVVTVSTPTPGQRLASGSVTFAGTASDPAGIKAVNARVDNRDTHEFLQPNGSWSAAPYWAGANLSSQQGGHVNWSLPVWSTLPNGNFQVDVQGVSAVARSATTVHVRFSVGPPDTGPPSVSVSSPQPQENFVTSSVTLSGSAADDVAVASVDYGIQQTASKLWLLGDGSWGPSSAGDFLQPATLASPGAASTNWSQTVSGLPDGAYQLQVRVTDVGGNLTNTFVQFSKGNPNIQAPAMTVTSPLPHHQYTTAPPFQGTSSDPVAVSTVAASIENTADGEWLQADGTWSAATEYFYPIYTAVPGSASVSWGPLNAWGALPSDCSCAVRFRTVDSWDNVTSSPQIFFYGAYDGTPPTGSVTTPAENQLMSSDQPFAISGTASDNVAVARVSVAVENRDNPAGCNPQNTNGEEGPNPFSYVSWLQRDGSWKCSRFYFPTVLSNPGAAATSWTTAGGTPALPALSPGDYAVIIQVIDTSKNAFPNATQHFAPVDFGYGPPASASSPGYVSIIFGRAQWVVSQNNPTCTPLPAADSPTLQQIADWMHTKGFTATGAVVTDWADQGGGCIENNAYAGWSQLQQLRTTDGWSMVSESLDHPTPFQPAERAALGLPALDYTSPAGEFAGPLSDLENHGFGGAWGMYAYPNNDYFDLKNNYSIALQTSVGTQDYAWGRTYQGGRNIRADQQSPWLQKTTSVQGAICATGQCAPCIVIKTGKDCTPAQGWPTNPGGSEPVYVNPAVLANLMTAGADQWDAVQFYRLIAGKGSFVQGHYLFSWDCTSPNWQDHYTFDTEVYCYNDFQTVLDAVPPHVLVVDPATVATAWGIGPHTSHTARLDGAPPAPAGLLTMERMARRLLAGVQGVRSL